MTHIEHLVHLFPVGARLLLNELEEGRNGEEVVLDYVLALYEVHYFSLCATRAVYHAVNLWAHSIEKFLNYGSVGASGRKHQLSGIAGNALYGIGKTHFSRIYQVVGYILVECLGIFFSYVFGEYVVTSRGEAVAAHSAIIFLLVGSLTRRSKAHNYVTTLDVGVVDYVGAAHAASHCAIHDDGAHQVAHVGSFAACGDDVHAKFAQLGKQFLGAIDDGSDNLTGNKHLVASDGRGEEDIVGSTHAEQVVDIHDESILCDAFPHAEVACFAPVGVGERRFCAGTVGVHDVAVVGVTTEHVGDYFAERFRIKTLVHILDGVVDVFFRCRNTA